MRKTSFTQQHKAINVICCVFILSLSGCSKMIPSITPSPTLITRNTQTEIIMTSPIATESVTPSPTATVLIVTSTAWSTAIPTPTITEELPTPTLSPTLTLDERNNKLLELLKTNAGCELPCIWGIIPGETNWEDAYHILFPLGDPGFEIHRDKYKIYNYEYQNFQDGYIAILGMLVNSGIIDIVFEQPLVYYDSNYLGQFWEQFSLHSLLVINGPPSRIWVVLTTGEYYLPDSTFFNIWLFYDRLGLLITYYDIAIKVNSDYQVCPNQPNFNASTPLQLSFLTQDPSNDRSLEEAYKLFTGAPIQGYQSLQDAAGLEINEFYDLIVQGNTGACFDTPRDIWP
jgi:hypothetical protein